MANSPLLAFLLLALFPVALSVGHHAIVQVQVSLESPVKVGSHLEIEVINENQLGCIVDNAVDPEKDYDEGSVILIEVRLRSLHTLLHIVNTPLSQSVYIINVT